MILKALYDYYNRCGNLPVQGKELKEISFLIVIDRDGHFSRIEDRRSDSKTAQKFLVPKGVGRSSAPTPNFLWDNPAYVLGISEANFDYDDSRLSARSVIVPLLNGLGAYIESIQNDMISRLFTTFISNLIS